MALRAQAQSFDTLKNHESRHGTQGWAEIAEAL
jgi:hypothetical protein